MKIRLLDDEGDQANRMKKKKKKRLCRCQGEHKGEDGEEIKQKGEQLIENANRIR